MERPKTSRLAVQIDDERISLEPFAPIFFEVQVKSLLLLLFASLMVLSACGGRSSNPPQSSGQLAGNWQFTMANPSDNSFLGGIQGGFLLQNNTSVTGAVVYTVLLPAQGSSPTICNSGSAPITGTVNGQSVSLTAVAGPQTFTLTGALSADGSTMMGTYTSTDGQGCGTAQTGFQWSATSVPPLTGSIQGNFHSVSVQNPALKNQVFPVTGSLTQGENIGASNATVTGTLNFQGYPCMTTASVNGQISGNSVLLQIIASNGLNVGRIGAPAGLANPSPAPVAVVTSAAGAVLQGANGYGLTTSACPGGNVPGDVGDVCLGLGSTTSCTQPILLSPASLSYPAQLVGSAPTSQTITLSNNNLSGTPLSGLSLSFALFNPQPGATSIFGSSDFDGLPSFTEQDNCASPPGSTFTLVPQQSCAITIAFSPQQSCPWLPSTEPPSSCPFPLFASLTVNSPVSADSNTAFAVPIVGAAFSAIVPSAPELDFGAETLGEMSVPQLLSFTNQGTAPVQILPALNSPCVNPVGVLTLPRPPAPGLIAGLQVETGIFNKGSSTISYICDSDLTSKQPNFQISADDCSGTLLLPQSSCSLEITFVPQPSTSLTSGLDYFLELNTQQCNSTTTSDCEIDSGRFPVELTANVASSLRMTPGAGLDFGIETRGRVSAPQTITDRKSVV